MRKKRMESNMNEELEYIQDIHNSTSVLLFDIRATEELIGNLLPTSCSLQFRDTEDTECYRAYYEIENTKSMGFREFCSLSKIYINVDEFQLQPVEVKTFVRMQTREKALHTMLKALIKRGIQSILDDNENKLKSMSTVPTIEG